MHRPTSRADGSLLVRFRIRTNWSRLASPRQQLQPLLIACGHHTYNVNCKPYVRSNLGHCFPFLPGEKVLSSPWPSGCRRWWHDLLGVIPCWLAHFCYVQHRGAHFADASPILALLFALLFRLYVAATGCVVSILVWTIDTSHDDRIVSVRSPNVFVHHKFGFWASSTCRWRDDIELSFPELFNEPC